MITFEWTRRKCFWKAGATGWGSAGRNRQDLTALETQAWSYELETRTWELAPVSARPTLTSPQNKILMSSGSSRLSETTGKICEIINIHWGLPSLLS